MADCVTSITNSVTRVLKVRPNPPPVPHTLNNNNDHVTLHLVPHVTTQLLRRGCPIPMFHSTLRRTLQPIPVPAWYLQQPSAVRELLTDRFGLVIDDDASVNALVSTLLVCFRRTRSVSLYAEFEVSNTTHVTSQEEELEEEWRGAVERLKVNCGFNSLGRTELGTCSICLDDLCSQKKLIRAPCSHLYHESCIGSWLKRKKNSCPLCRTQVIQLL